jgi:methylase of polypeptide subunit release factors
MNADPSHILQLGTGFFGSKVLLSAVELDLFTVLHDGAATADELAQRIGIHDRSARDFFDALVALGMLQRSGNGPGATYANTPDTATFLDKESPAYLGGILEMANARLYRFWADLTEALRTGKPQSEMKHTGEPFFATLYADTDRLEQFLRAMSGIQMGNFHALADAFDFSRWQSVCDVGGADGSLCRTLAGRHPHLRLTVFDLAPAVAIARRQIDAARLSDRIETQAGDFFADPLPRADIITMGNILHDWGLEEKKTLIRKAYESLTPGGALIAIENVIDDERRSNAFGLLVSLNMLIETPDGFDYTGADFAGWCREAGFSSTEVIPLAGPASAAIAYK